MKNEVDTWQLIALALKQGKNVGVPLCIGKGIMEVRQIHALDDFEEGHMESWNHPEGVQSYRKRRLIWR